MGAKRPLNGVRKCDGQTHKQTDRHTYGHFDLQKESAQRADSVKTTGKTFNSEKHMLAVIYEDLCQIMECFKQDYILVVRETMNNDDLLRRSLLASDGIN